VSSYRKNLNNINAHRNRSNNPEEMFDLTMNNLLDSFYDHALDTSTDGKFKAVCLSGFMAGDNTAGNDGFMAAKQNNDFGTISIIVRPLQPFAEVLPDPRQGKNASEVVKFLSLHKAFTAVYNMSGEQDEAPQFGELVECHYEEGSISRGNAGLLRYEPLSTGADLISSYLALEHMDGISTAIDAFGKGRPAVLGAPVGELGDKDPKPSADLYEKTTMDQKSDHLAKYEAGLMHPRMWLYFKAIVYDIHNLTGGSVVITSAYRSYHQQKEMRAKYEKWERETGEGNEPPNAPYAGKPATAGNSNHNHGFAVDFNVTGITADGFQPVYDRYSVTKQQWIDSGIPAIINSYGLQWGGVFGYYDPIHMDINVSPATKSIINQKTKSLSSVKEAMEIIKTIQIETVNLGIIPAVTPPAETTETTE
tara:strand:- start:5009 stop:6271 length:1263 start_codon:yes stop_codon:yes gene_type:complete